MRYRIALYESEEGFAVSVPGLPGCWSQGTSEAEAIENIKDAIREYLTVVEQQLRGESTRETRYPFSIAENPGISHLAAVRALEKRWLQGRSTRQTH